VKIADKEGNMCLEAPKASQCC